MNDTATALEVAHASVSFGDVTAVSDVSFSVRSGSTLAVLGPSGSGKSTLLRAIAGLETLAAGSVAIGGENQASVPINERQLGMMFQDHALFPHLDVAANVGFGLKMRGVTGPAATARTTEVLDLVGLAGFGRRDVQTLSGGEAQRVALAGVQTVRWWRRCRASFWSKRRRPLTLARRRSFKESWSTRRSGKGAGVFCWMNSQERSVGSRSIPILPTALATWCRFGSITPNCTRLRRDDSGSRWHAKGALDPASAVVVGHQHDELK